MRKHPLCTYFGLNTPSCRQLKLSKNLSAEHLHNQIISMSIFKCPYHCRFLAGTSQSGPEVRKCPILRPPQKIVLTHLSFLASIISSFLLFLATSSPYSAPIPFSNSSITKNTRVHQLTQGCSARFYSQ